MRLPLLAVLVASAAHAEPDTFGVGTGRSGDQAIQGAVAVNRYTRLVAPAPRGSTRLSVEASAGIAASDLIMLHQARLAGPPPPPGVDGVFDLRTTGLGRFELARVERVEGQALVLTAPVDHGFPALVSQVIFVPEYRDLNIEPTAAVVAPPWDGTTGGVVALLVARNLISAGRVQASSAGYRGGASRIDPTSAHGCDAGDLPSPLGAMKGEGPATDWGPGASGTPPVLAGGGGGTCHNAGGGGGSHHGRGGVGGRGVSGRDNGGLGGHVSRLDPLLQLTFGGGGGAGQSNDRVDTAGGRGGGVVFIRAFDARVSFSAWYHAEGDASSASVDDGVGGGGAGGTVHLRSAGLWECSAAYATGGDGALALPNVGSGGGGGGGRVLVQAGSLSCAADVTAGKCDGSRAADGGGVTQPRGCTDGESGSALVLPSPFTWDGGVPVDPWPFEPDGGNPLMTPTDGGWVPPRFVTAPNAVAFCGAPYRYSTLRRPEVVGDRPLTFSLSGAVPHGASVEPSTGELRWTPAREQAGVHAFELAVDGPGGTARQPVEVTVECAGQPAMRAGCGCSGAGGAFGLMVLLAAVPAARARPRRRPERPRNA